MSRKQPQLYEGMYIISAKLSDEARRKAFEKITVGITSHGGELVKIHEQGRKKLAYEINTHREGYYYLVYFSALPAVIEELWDEYHISEDLIRFITLRTDKVLEKIEFKTIVE
ncbi:MAG: 30S ribosomal protein S6 [Parachlamydiales bacterium]|jgi:small subunit ribosomal protein S6